MPCCVTQLLLLGGAQDRRYLSSPPSYFPDVRVLFQTWTVCVDFPIVWFSAVPCDKFAAFFEWVPSLEADAWWFRLRGAQPLSLHALLLPVFLFSLLWPWVFTGRTVHHIPRVLSGFFSCHIFSLSTLQSVFSWPDFLFTDSLHLFPSIEFLIYLSSVQSLSHVRLFATPWIAACQASLSITSSWSLLKLMPIELVMPSSHLILCHPLLLLPPIPPSITVFSNESTLRIRWPKY